MFYNLTKRLVDIVGAVILGIIFSPVCLITAMAIKLDSPGPILADTPMRVGKDGQLFKMYKFRSMVSDAHRLLRGNPQFKKLYEQYKRNSYKLKEDPRI